VKVEELSPEGPAVNRLKVLRDRQKEIVELIAKWQAKMNRPELVDLVADKLAELEAARKDNEMELADAERESGTTLAGAMRELKTIAKVLDTEDNEPNRLRCQAAIRAAVSAVYCLFMPGRGQRLAVVQVFFKGGAHRSYIIRHKPAGKSRWGSWPASTAVRAFAEEGLSAGDLRKPEEAEKLEMLLAKHLNRDDAKR
jgi:hypothetical protein